MRRNNRLCQWFFVYLVGFSLALIPPVFADTEAEETPSDVDVQEASEEDSEAEPPSSLVETDEGEKAPDSAGDDEDDEDDDTEEEKSDDRLGALDAERYHRSARLEEVPFSGGQGKVIFLIQIDGVIDLGLAPFIVRVIKEAGERDDVIAVVSEINTPGGRVDAAVTIKDAFLSSKKPTIAWVHTQAISAGALIAFSHDYIIFSGGGTMGAATPVQMGAGGGMEDVSEKIVSYMRSVMRATAEEKDRDGDVAEAMVDKTIGIPGVISDEKLLTLTIEKALEIGIGDGRADSWSELLALLKLEGAKKEVVGLNWAEELARILTGPELSSLLMGIGMLGIFLELSSPGFGLPGIVGITAITIVFLGHYVVNLAGIEEILLLLLGLILLGLEIFVIPGFGLAGIAGMTCVMLSMVFMLVALPISVSWDLGHLPNAIVRVSTAMAFTVVMMYLFFRFFPGTRFGRGFILSTPDGVEMEPGLMGEDGGIVQAGMKGVVEMDLRPAGKARIAGELVDVVSQGDYLEIGASVEVIRVDGNRVVVKEDSAQDGEA